MGLYKSTTVRRRLDGSPYRTESKNWYGSFMHPHTKRQVQVNLKVPDKSAAQTLLADMIVKAQKDDRGLIAASSKRDRRTLTDHATDWHAVILADGNSKRYADMQKYRAVRIVNGCEFKCWQDIKADRVRVPVSLGSVRRCIVGAAFSLHPRAVAYTTHRHLEPSRRTICLISKAPPLTSRADSKLWRWMTAKASGRAPQRRADCSN